MGRFAGAFQEALLVLWVGGLWMVGYGVAPTLFATLGDRQLAGLVAGKLFALVGWVGVVAAAVLLTSSLLRSGASALRRLPFWLVVAMLALTLAGQFGVQPLIAQLKAEAWPREVMESVVRDRFVAWHGIASVLYLLESLLGLALVAVLPAKWGR